ncbi:hypothetical protein RAS2_08910 [Phycisphaerae bacterium RAS2]|nr:hypothetical protein RAS2_08910 [Phycisphaerae bacterium RAS2]
MDFVKKQWKMLVVSVVALASLGMGYFAYAGGDAVIEQLNGVSSLVSETEKYKRSAANKETIKAKAEDIEARNAEFAKSMDAALAMQKYNAYEATLERDGSVKPRKRTTLIEKALPKPESNAVAIQFKDAYIQAHAQLAERLRARDKATPAEVGDQERLVAAMKVKAPADSLANPWGGAGITDIKGDIGQARERELSEFLRDYPAARAAEDVARRIYMYLSPNALGRHSLARSDEAPDAESIWHAQMSLWIQQDIVTALARCNEARAAELAAAKREEDAWVAFMPVKHLVVLRIANRLGKGGGSNSSSRDLPLSFTGVTNNEKMFVVPLQLEVIVETAALNSVLDSICRVGFYTPISVSYTSVDQSPLQDDYLYGDAPVVRATIAMEGYYIRSVFEEWIPESLKAVLKAGTAGDPSDFSRGGG